MLLCCLSILSNVHPLRLFNFLSNPGPLLSNIKTHFSSPVHISFSLIYQSFPRLLTFSLIPISIKLVLACYVSYFVNSPSHQACASLLSQLFCHFPSPIKLVLACYVSYFVTWNDSQACRLEKPYYPKLIARPASAVGAWFPLPSEF